MRKLIPLLLVLLLCSCSLCAVRDPAISPAAAAPETGGSIEPAPVSGEPTAAEPPTEAQTSEPPDQEEQIMQMMINDTPVNVQWEENESVAALMELVQEAPLTIHMSPYGGFEQVGPIGRSLPRNDVQTVTGSGDIVLYSGNQLVLFYGSNTWSYTRLGHITDKTPSEMAELLGNGAVTITINMGEAT